MNRSVVTHHCTAWWRSQRAISRCTTGRVCRRRSGRRGKGVAWATPAAWRTSLTPLQSHQEAVRQHHSDRMPVEASPQAALVVIPAQLALGLLMELLDRMAAMGIAGQLACGSVSQQVTATWQWPT
jgi:hypothetical protein